VKIGLDTRKQHLSGEQFQAALAAARRYLLARDGMADLGF